MIKRYSVKDIDDIWNEDSVKLKWIDLELKIFNYLMELNKLNFRLKLKPPSIRCILSSLNEIEKDVNHDFNAILIALDDFIPKQYKWALHYGLTSSDIKDTVTSCNLKSSINILQKDITSLFCKLKIKASEFKYIFIPSTTHGKIAQLTTIGIKFLSYSKMIKRRLKVINKAEKELKGKLSGVTGLRKYLDIESEEKILKDIGLKPQDDCIQIIQRDIYSDLIYSIVIYMMCLSKICIDLRLMNQDRYEFVSISNKGETHSSAMPHKSNPIVFERICGLARLSKGYAQSAFDNIELWGSRDMTHSSNERVIFNDLFNIAVYSTRQMLKAIENIKCNKSLKKEEIPKYISQARLMKLREAGMNILDCHNEIKNNFNKDLNLFGVEYQRTKDSIINIFNEI